MAHVKQNKFKAGIKMKITKLIHMNIYKGKTICGSENGRTLMKTKS